MIREKVLIKNMGNLHLRPAKEISKVASQYKCSIKLISNNISANGKSIISLLGSCVKFGEYLELACDGVDEKEAFEAMKDILTSFGTN